MSEPMPNAVSPKPSSLHCPRCGQAMRVAAEHLRVEVACPRCSEPLEPWRLIAPTPAGVPRAGRNAVYFSTRNRWIAGALGVLLGPFGVHRFYLGFTGIGILQAALTVGSCFVLYHVIWAWGIIEGILCFCGTMRDVDGMPLRD